ncbi:hypothetical protein [Glutamicibacter ardleyensis]|uniref:hypothetical protein n=1 Tax=Glutamicibacter ardleyensis TaxID=225894 RepID=UPI003FD03741
MTENMLKFEDLSPGDRIVVRYRLTQTSPETGNVISSDALGEVLAVTSDTVSINTKRGALDVARQAITHAKRVPPPPVRRSRPPTLK